jgi:two-component system response regulator DesR
MNISVLIVDDEAMLREALVIILSHAPGIGTVKAVASGAEALALPDTADVVVMDYDMPGQDGLTAAEYLLKRDPNLPILMLTRHARPGLMRQAQTLGVRGFMTKGSAPRHLLEAITTLLETGRYIDPQIAAAAVAHDCPLTDRELDVLRLSSRGLSAASIAAQLYLSPGTVRNYISSALLKTNTARREQAVEYARSQHWI